MAAAGLAFVVGGVTDQQVEGAVGGDRTAVATRGVDLVTLLDTVSAV